MITLENIELIKEAIKAGKTPEEILQEAEEIKTEADRIQSERTSCVAMLNTLIAKVNNWEFDNSLDNLDYIIAKNLLAGSKYNIVDTTPITEEVWEQ